MPCDNCGGAIVEVNVDPVKDSGRFKEEYKCVNCNARGWVRGKEQDPPTQWDRSGKAFGRC